MQRNLVTINANEEEFPLFRLIAAFWGIKTVNYLCFQLSFHLFFIYWHWDLYVKIQALSIFLWFSSNRTRSSLEALLISMLVPMLLGFHGVSDWEALMKSLYPPNKVNLWNQTKLPFSLSSPCFWIWRCKHLNLHMFINNLFVESSLDARRCYGNHQTWGFFYECFWIF